MNKAVFFDRDGTLSNEIDGRSPIILNDMEVFSDIECLKKLKDYDLFLVSNQSDVSNGRISLSDWMEIHTKFDNILKSKKIYFKEYYYCFHRKEDICWCRKPSPYFLLKAKNDYDINLSKSWMVGNMDVDIQCGKEAGVKTIKIGNGINLKEAVEMILNENIC